MATSVPKGKLAGRITSVSMERASASSPGTRWVAGSGFHVSRAE